MIPRITFHVLGISVEFTGMQIQTGYMHACIYPVHI